MFLGFQGLPKQLLKAQEGSQEAILGYSGTSWAFLGFSWKPGSVFILFMNNDGTVSDVAEIDANIQDAKYIYNQQAAPSVLI